jgi:hypothetical protein
MQINKNKIKIWYKENLGKIVLLFIILVIFTLTIAYTPYLNILFSPLIEFMIVFIAWYLLFNPTIFILVFIGILVSGITLITTLLRLSLLSDAIGEYIYLLIVLIVISFIKQLLNSSRIK